MVCTRPRQEYVVDMLARSVVFHVYNIIICIIKISPTAIDAIIVYYKL